MVVLSLNDGEELSGVLKEDNDQQVVIDLGDNNLRTIPKSAIKERIDAASSMPPVTSVLTKAEIRDLVEFLYSLKSDES